LIIWNYRGHWKQALTADETQDEEIRKKHFFSSGQPNVDLASSFINLSKPKKIGQNFIDLCDHISSIMQDYSQNDYLLAINFIQQFLTNAKMIFLKDSPQGKPDPKTFLCDSYLADIDLLRGLVASKHSSKVSLIDLTDNLKVR
jgi:hypothetical protein